MSDHDLDDIEDVDHNRIDDADAADTDDADLGDEPTIAEDVLAYLTRSVVEDPDAVNIDIEESGNRLKMTVTVGDGDMGRVIGRRGRIANAIRTIVRAAGTRDDVEVEVEFED
jgi:predicted RNA-binding protein YlqC (UPF0109 family)